MMAFNFRWLFLLCLCVLVSCEKQQAPALFFTLDGRGIDALQLQNKVLVINYWAEWCKPCIKEIPELNRFYMANSDKVLLVGVNYDELPADTVLAQASKMGITFPLVQGGVAKVFSYPEVEVLPTTLFIDSVTRHQLILKGPQSMKTLEKTLAGFLKEN